MRYTIQFYPDKVQGKADAYLRCRVRWHEPDGSYANVSVNVGYKVTVASWSSADQRCKRNTTHGQYTAQEVNQQINKIDNLISTIFTSSESLTKEQFKAKLKMGLLPSPQEPHTPTVTEAIKLFIDDVADGWSEGTQKKFKTLANRIKNLDIDVPITSVDKAYVATFVRECSLVMKNNSAHKEWKNLMWFLRWCSSVKLLQTDFDDYQFKLKQYEHQVTFLDWEELMKLWDCPMPTQHMTEVKDAFLFCCFSGLRYSDVRHLSKTNCNDDHIVVTTIKTGKKIIIPLNKYSKSILDKYKHYDSTNRAFPVPNNADMNETLKEIFDVVGINREITTTTYQGNKRIEETNKLAELITTHTGRRTFVCNSLMLGIPAEVLMKITGHSSYASLKPYINITDQAKRDAMSLYDKK